MTKPMTEPRGVTILTQFWGDTHRDYLLNWCIPSILASGNLPAIPGKHRFTVACPWKEFAAFIATPIARELAKHAQIVHVSHEGHPPPQDSCRHMSAAHRLMTAMVWRDRSLVFPVTPDMVVSNGTLRKAYDCVLEGATAVVTPAVRFEQEALFDGLAEFVRSGAALEVSGRALAKVAVAAFHPETLRWEWEAPYVLGSLSAVWTRHGAEGVQIHSLSYAPLLLDYAALPEHDDSVFDKWTMDGDYIFANWGDDLSRVRLIDDSDDGMVVGFTPREQKKKALVKYHLDADETEIAKARGMCSAYWSGVFDPLKRRLFLHPVRWHKGELSSAWRKREADFAGHMERYIDTWRVAVEFSARMRDYKTPESEIRLGIPAPLRVVFTPPADDRAAARAGS